MKPERLKYELVMDFIKNGIYTGSLKKGDKIYSESQLMAKFNVSRHTVRQAIMNLSQEGCIETLHGRGSFVVWEENKVDYSKKEPRTILVIASYLNNHIFPEIIREIEELASKNKYAVMISCTQNRIFKERDCLSMIMDSELAWYHCRTCKECTPPPQIELYTTHSKKKIYLSSISMVAMILILMTMLL